MSNVYEEVSRKSHKHLLPAEALQLGSCKGKTILPNQKQKRESGVTVIQLSPIHIPVISATCKFLNPVDDSCVAKHHAKLYY